MTGVPKTRRPIRYGRSSIHLCVLSTPLSEVTTFLPRSRTLQQQSVGTGSSWSKTSLTCS